MPSSSIERSPDNRYASILIIISRGDDILTVLDYDSLKDSSEPFDCEIEQYTAFLGTAGILTSMELTFNSLLVRLRASNYPSGNYTVEFRGIANDDSRWYSNTFDFVIE